mgnify:CR=1 FL=1
MQSIPKTVKEKCRGVNGKQLALKCAPYVIFGYVFNKVSWLYGQQAGDNTLQKVLDTINGMGGAFANPFPSFMPRDLLVGVGCGIGFRMVVYYKAKNAKKFRQGVEYGSARWGTAKDIEPYVDPVFENNVLLTATERLMMSGRPKQPKYARNKNILVIGGSGSGKTRFFVKPNLMQMHSSYVVTDPKGTVLVECGKMLSKNDYRIKVLNTINFAKSMHYNPFAYIRSEKDILKLVNTIIVNTKGEGQQASEDFWVKAEKLYYTALIAYIWYEAPEEEQNFSMLIDLVDASEAREDDENFKNAVDLLFEELGVPPQRIITAGGGTKNAAWMQIICDMAGMPLTIPELFQCSSYGDAMLAALGVGALESFAALRAALPQGRILQPDRKNHEFYQEHYPIFRDLYLENRDRMHRMQK